MARQNTTGATRRGTAPRGDDVRPADEESAVRDAAEAPENTPEGADEEGAGTSTYLVPGLERGLRILTEFSASEPVLTDFGQPVLERLRDSTGLSSHLLIRDGRDVVFVAKAQTHDPMFSSVKVHVGTRLPAHATVHGQVLMGDFTLAELRTLYPEKQLERYTDRTPATVTDLYARIRESAEQGYALSEGSFETGISVVSAPVRDHSGKIAAAITVTVPRSDIGGDAQRAPLIAAVCGAAVDLSTRLNYRPRANDPTAAHATRNRPLPAGFL
jgi:DNA-binding IclR family transcriptional regulator